MMGYARLRNELSRLVGPPDGATVEWLNAQIRNMDALRGKYEHSIQLCMHADQADDEANCFIHALGIDVDDVRELCSDKVFPNSRFVTSLLNGPMAKKSIDVRQRKNGDIVIYFDASGKPVHAGVCKGNHVISKWGTGLTHVWAHGLWEVPVEYGNRVRVFRPISTTEITAHFESWVESETCGSGSPTKARAE